MNDSGIAVFIIGAVLGFLAGFAVVASAMENYEEIQKSESGYFVEHEGKIYQLVEIKMLNEAIGK